MKWISLEFNFSRLCKIYFIKRWLNKGRFSDIILLLMMDFHFWGIEWIRGIQLKRDYCSNWILVLIFPILLYFQYHRTVERHNLDYYWKNVENVFACCWLRYLYYTIKKWIKYRKGALEKQQNVGSRNKRYFYKIQENC